MPDVISRDVDDEGYEYGFCRLRRWLEVIGLEAQLLRDRVSVFREGKIVGNTCIEFLISQTESIENIEQHGKY